MANLSRVIVLALALSCLCSSVSALTNGTLLPAYICGPTGVGNVALDGFPKSLGAALTFFVLNTNPFLPPTIIQVDGEPRRVDRPLDNANGGQLNNTQALVGGFHNNALNVNFGPPVAFKANNGITTLVYDAKGNVQTTIQAGATVNIAVASSPNGVVNNDVAMDGIVLYAVDANGARVGTFTAFGTPAGDTVLIKPLDAQGVPVPINVTSIGVNAQPWAACGVNNVGIVHTQLLQCVGIYTGIQWQAPFNLVVGTKVTFQGAGVTDLGFGGHVTAFTVTAPPVIPPPPTITTVFSQGQNSAVFFVDKTKGAKINAATVFTAQFTLLGAAAPFATLSVAQSPAVFNLISLLQKANITVTTTTITSITITASNTAGTSAPSGAIELVPLRVPAPVAQAFLDLCPVAFQAQAAVNGQPTDTANQCAWQAQQAAAIINAAGSVFGPNATTVNNVGNAASSIAAPTQLLFALIVAVFLAAFRF